MMAAVLLLVLPETLLGANRVANKTLNLPDQPPVAAYTLENAFPDLRFSNPVAIVQMPGLKDRVFVVEKAGRIRMVTLGDDPQGLTFMSLTDRVRSGGERGLLGLAFHPNYAENGFFYVFYTAQGSGSPNRLSRFSANPDDRFEGVPNTEVILIDQRDDAGNHNGGDLHFGPDGYLYVALGDEGNANDSLNNSQRIDKDFFAGILRIDVDKRPGSLLPNQHAAATDNYAIPPDNPFVGADTFLNSPVNPDRVRTEFWAVGLRNPWRMAFDPVTGLLYTGDVGQGRLEEVDIIQKGGNYGWSFKEGTEDGPDARRAPEGFTDIPPVLEYRHGAGLNRGNSITGGVVYRGDRLSQLYGAYIFADYVSGNIWAMRHEGNRQTAWFNLARDSGIAGFGIDPRQGDILLADHNANRIMRLVASDETPNVTFPPTLADTGAFKDLSNLMPQPGIEPYEINTPFWSDHSIKKRWFLIPGTEASIGFQRGGSWTFPEGSIWIKHFDLEMVRGEPSSVRRLETRFLVKHEDGIYGLTYRWDDSQENAFLVEEAGFEETFNIQVGEETIEQVWRYPSRSECLACHTPSAGLALGFNTAQLNRSVLRDDSDVSQLSWMKSVGYFHDAPKAINTLPAMVSADDSSVSLTQRVKSYLASNCSQCHRPGGEALGRWDARYETPVLESGLINGHVVRDEGQTDRRLIVPGNLELSEIYQRISDSGTRRMPPVGSHVLDEEGIDLIKRWVTTTLPDKSYTEWSQHFSQTLLVQELDALADNDQDGWNNLSEFYLGTDPTFELDHWRLSLDVARKTLFFPMPSNPKIEFQLEASNSLGSDADWQQVEILETAEPVFGYKGLQESKAEGIREGSKFFRAIMTFPELE
ncbi:PQQ-dependent sugar dehydrogenase [bacterium]|nr:PQQ-dependent sugar dehydrogenase [bacterium]